MNDVVCERRKTCLASDEDGKSSVHDFNAAIELQRGGQNRAYAHAGSRTRVTSMGGLYDAATLRALAGD